MMPEWFDAEVVKNAFILVFAMKFPEYYK